MTARFRHGPALDRSNYILPSVLALALDADKVIRRIERPSAGRQHQCPFYIQVRTDGHDADRFRFFLH